MNKKEIVLKECAVRGNDGTLKPSDQHSKPIDLPPSFILLMINCLHLAQNFSLTTIINQKMHYALPGVKMNCVYHLFTNVNRYSLLNPCVHY